MFRYFTKIDGFLVVLKNEDILGVEDVGTHRIVTTVICDYDVIDTIQSIFVSKPNNLNFSEN
jgi:hypothetical protein